MTMTTTRLRRGSALSWETVQNRATRRQSKNYFNIESIKMKIEVPATIMATTKIHMQLRNILMMFPEAFACILCHHASCFRCPASSIQPKNSHFHRTPHPNQLLFKLDFSLDNFSFFSAPIFCSLCLSHSLFTLGRTFL